MSYIWELSIADMDGSEFYFPIASEKQAFDQIVKECISIGKPVIEKWIPPLIIKKEEKYAYDFFHIRDRHSSLDISIEEEDEYIPEDAICISQRAYDDLFPIVKDEVEFLPMLSDEGMYYILNVTNYLDCLDLSSSTCNFAPN